MTTLDLLVSVGGGIAGVIAFVLFCVAIWKRAELRAYLLRKLGLWSAGAVVDNNRIPEKAKDYQALKDNVTLVGVLIAAVFWMVWFTLFQDWWTPIILCAVVTAIIVCGWLFVVLGYSRRYISKRALEVTMHEAFIDPDSKEQRWRRFTDHWGIEEPQELKPDDPRIVSARATIKTALEMWRHELTEEEEGELESAQAAKTSA